MATKKSTATKPAATKATKATKPAPQAPAQAQPAPVVALRGGLVLGVLALSGKPYRVAAPHNVSWWDTTQKVLAQAGGKAPVQDIVKAGVPASMVGYLFRRGYLQAA